MAGHSKWANIKRRKGAQDAKRGQLFSKLSKAITLAAKNGGDPDANLGLKYAIDKAKQGNMPKDTIATAIKKGTGEIEGIVYEELMYEGFALGGVAIIVEALSDNRNRTTPEVKKIFERAGGNVGAQGCVAFMFEKKGIIALPAEGIDEDELFETVTEADGEDYELSDDTYVITTDLTSLHTVSGALEAKGWTVESAELEWVPSNTIKVDADKREKIERLVETLEEHDDVSNVFTNLDDEDEAS